MILIFVFSFLLFGASCGDRECEHDNCYGNEEVSEIDAIKPEDPCSMEGGLCIIAADCPQGKMTAQTGLCPEQQSQGVECCYGLSTKETRCSKHGGDCISSIEFCNEQLVYKEASDCNNDEKCCIRAF